nr:hypothetical protein [Streptomyces sp. TLI_235]
MLFEIAFCFRCRAAALCGAGVSGKTGSQTFDPASAPGQALLRRFQEAAAAAG